MSMVVQHNLQAMNSNRMLGITTSSQSKSTEKLSSGYKINRAADDAAGLTISEKMRKQMRGLDRASTNAQDGVSAVQTAEGALTEVHSMLQRMNELAVQSANGTNSDSDREAIQAEIDQLVTEIDRVSETTKFNEIYLLKGDASQPETTKTVGDYKYEMTQAALDAKEVTFTVTANAYAGGETDAVTAGAAAANATISFSDQGGGTNHLYVSAAGNWGDTVEVDATNFSTYFDVDDNGDVVEKITGATYGVAASAAAAAGGVQTAAALKTAGWLATTPKTSAVEDGISKYVEVVDGTLKYKEGQILYSAAADADVTNEYGDQTEQKNNKIDEDDLGNYFGFSSNPLINKDGDEITDVSAYFKNGVYQGGIYRNDTATGNTRTEIGADQISNWVKVTEPTEVTVAAALEFNLHVGADSDTTNKIGVKIDAMSAKGIGVDGLKVDSEDAATAAIDTIAAAIQQVSSQRSALGAIQNRLEHTIANLDNIVENTTAAESRIRDTDMAEEMVEYSKNNILAQAGQSMLAQANQSTQGVLSLLG